MSEQKTWRADVTIAEDGDVTRATAVLSTDDGRSFQGDGLARRNPRTRPRLESATSWPPLGPCPS